MNISLALHAILAATILPLSAVATDLDGDAIDDDVEDQLLSRFAPVWRADNSSQRPPLSLSWYVKHCQLRWYDQEYNGSSNPGRLLGDTGTRQLDLPLLIDYPYNPNVYYRLAFKEGRFRDGDDPNDQWTWERAQREKAGVFGRVVGLPFHRLMSCGATADPTFQPYERFLLQYFMFFGYNKTDHPDESFGGCGNLGEHEGDVIGVEFEVAWPKGAEPRIVSAVYNNHGRKIFIDSADLLRFEGGRPLVYLERESQEPVPWPGLCGFAAGAGVPRGIATDRIFVPTNVETPWGDYSAGGECEDWQVVREHRGEHFGFAESGFLVTQVVNLGEKTWNSCCGSRTGPRNNFAARFLDAYPGLFGDEAYDQAFFCYIFGKAEVAREIVTSPKSPQLQSPMWCREGNDAPRIYDWPGLLSEAFVDSRHSGEEEGSRIQPFRSLPTALPWLTTGGTITFLGGDSDFTGTISQPLTLRAESPITIGR